MPMPRAHARRCGRGENSCSALSDLISEISDADALSLSLPARSFELPGFLCSWLVMVVAEA